MRSGRADRPTRPSPLAGDEPSERCSSNPSGPVLAVSPQIRLDKNERQMCVDVCAKVHISARRERKSHVCTPKPQAMRPSSNCLLLLCRCCGEFVRPKRLEFALLACGDGRVEVRPGAGREMLGRRACRPRRHPRPPNTSGQTHTHTCCAGRSRALVRPPREQ
jgi:hypothetical protein